MWPEGEDALSADCRDLVDRLLQPDPQQRLGARGAGEVRSTNLPEGGVFSVRCNNFSSWA